MLKRSLFLLGFTNILSLSAVLARVFTITNRCPLPVTLYVSGGRQGTLNADGGTTQREFPEDWSGYIYTDANGGNGEKSERVARAGFYGPNDYYYIVVDPYRANTGISIIPKAPVHDGFCGPISVDTGTFSSAYQTTPFPDGFPPVTSNSPSSPLYSCPGTDIEYEVIFCPAGVFPRTGAVAIHPNGNTSKCLDVRGSIFANGTPVQIYDCNGTAAQKWTINASTTKIVLAGTEFCLDAGSNPGNNVGMKIWRCYDDLPAQAWLYTTDNRIGLYNTDQCLDLTDGSTQNSNRVQTYKCTNLNTNQFWTL
ncbi:G-X-X-X-Q-X-W domain-containing protein [Collybia nuda]|uniref:G-X-X-X-Q-X-W domain-containing protein n=1 Tax=Collybia nuda TaxID=64659 RepID=A0A9P5YDY3_9AGAR|nr:G-X-X-X-Q-X-W domain-containing protein [Collybia nuda]